MICEHHISSVFIHSGCGSTDSSASAAQGTPSCLHRLTSLPSLHLQAPPKIKVGDRVWLRNQAKGADTPFVPAAVTNSQQNGARLTVKRDGQAEEVLDTSKSDVFPANESKMMTNDHCALIHLNEPCVLENTKMRYEAGKIYTYTGKILVALNPFGQLPSVYGCAAACLPL